MFDRARSLEVGIGTPPLLLIQSSRIENASLLTPGPKSVRSQTADGNHWANLFPALHSDGYSRSGVMHSLVEGEAMTIECGPRICSLNYMRSKRHHFSAHSHFLRLGPLRTGSHVSHRRGGCFRSIINIALQYVGS